MKVSKMMRLMQKRSEQLQDRMAPLYLELEALDWDIHLLACPLRTEDLIAQVQKINDEFWSKNEVSFGPQPKARRRKRS
jgi:hypothetical protein